MTISFLRSAQRETASPREACRYVPGLDGETLENKADAIANWSEVT
jgi:hypothetical protein